MRVHRFQNTVAESAWTLPATVILVVLVWALVNLPHFHHGMGLIACALTTYLVLETNNTYALNRIRTQLSSAALLAGWGAMTFLHSNWQASVCMTALAASYFLLFDTYQQREPVGRIFFAFACLGCGSYAFPPLLFLVPFYGFYMAAYLRVLTLRTFCAAGLGIILPYWIEIGYNFYIGDFTTLLAHGQAVHFRPRLLWFAQWSGGMWAAWITNTALGIIAIIHYLRNYYDDKIRVRMLWYIIILQQLVLSVLVILYSQASQAGLALQHVNSSILVAHFFAVTSSRWTNILFILTLLTWAAIAVVNIYGSNY